MRDEVLKLLELECVPTNASADEAFIAFEDAMRLVEPPLTDEEAEALMRMFSDTDDDGFGLAWSLVHLIETSPTPLPKTRPTQPDNYWLGLLYDRHAQQ